MSLILSLLSSPKLLGLIGAVIAVIAGMFKAYSSGKKTGKNEILAKQKEADDALVKQGRKAADARAAANSGGVSDDPNNIDRD